MALKWVALALLALAGSWLAYDFMALPPAPPTLEAYLAGNPSRTRTPTGYSIEGQPATCASSQVVLDTGLDDVAAAHPGFIILNPRKFDRLPGVVKLYAFSHECGHQLHGPDEDTADCYAVTRGEAQGWLTAKGIQDICDFWKPYAGDSAHLPGPERCQSMLRCFERAQASRG